MDDVIILGGGVIGLSLAYELAYRGDTVRLIDRAEPGREASWAGAGILPPGNRRTAEHAYDQLAGLSHELHPRWAERLREETGIDTGYRRTGGLCLASDAAAAADLNAAAAEYRRREIAVEEIDPSRLAELEPALAADGDTSRFHAALRIADEAQIRNPRHLKALISACQRRGVRIDRGAAAEALIVEGERIVGVRTSSTVLTAGKYCLACGPWSGALLAPLGIALAAKPVRGQMVLLDAAGKPPRHILNEGARYIVPRDDGRVLVGSTEEDAGFDKRPTSTGVAELLQFALALAPGLEDAAIERCWAGLRPGTADRLPYLGPIPGLKNGFIATGHFRSGLHLSTGTAVAIAELIRGETPQIDLQPFAVDR